MKLKIIGLLKFIVKNQIAPKTQACAKIIWAVREAVSNYLLDAM
jgi:hypothetical protein